MRDDPMPAGARTAPAVTDTETDANGQDRARAADPRACGTARATARIRRHGHRALGADGRGRRLQRRGRLDPRPRRRARDGGSERPAGGGLHGTRISGSGRDGGSSPPRRFVLPDGALRT